MVAAFGSIMEISTAKAALVLSGLIEDMVLWLFLQHFLLENIVIKRAILLALYAFGALLFFPAAKYEVFGFFLISLYILTFGLAFLETTANPYILSMGDERISDPSFKFSTSF